MKITDILRAAREAHNLDPLVQAIPYARFMGLSMTVEGDEVVGRLAFRDHLIGNAAIGALHGGTLGALLESTAIFTLLWRAETVSVPKTINITVQYLRSGKARDTYARAEITRHGRRIANVSAIAWQDDPGEPIAAATAHFLLVPAEAEEG